MASHSNPTVIGSDRNCVKSCNLKYGISDIFNQNVAQQQKIKQPKAHIKLQLFDDQTEQAKFDHLMDDVLLKTFDNESEKSILQKAFRGMESNYPEILNGTQKNMFYCPTAFNTDSRIKPTETSVPDVLEKIQVSLESKPSLTTIEQASLKIIRDHLARLRPQLAEQEFVDALACFFYQHRGIFIHSLKLNDHLRALTDTATLARRQDKNLAFSMTDIEKKLAEQLNISERSLSDFANDFIEHLKSNPKLDTKKPINGRVVWEAIDDNLKGHDNTHFRKLFKPGSYYSFYEIVDGIKLGKFQSDCRFQGENDLLIMLPDHKLILCVEIKRHMDPCGPPPSKKTKSTCVIDTHMKDASNQLLKNAEFVSVRHGAILSPEWRLVKICAISPSLKNSEKICRNCHRFILTSEIINTPGALQKWWKDTGLSDRDKTFHKIKKGKKAKNALQKIKDKAYNEFQMFFYRLVCLSSVRVVPDPFYTWKQIQGNNPHHISGGHTKDTSNAQTQNTAGSMDVKDVLHRSHDAYKVLFFNKDQNALLVAENLSHVLFMCDFGSGKSLISKEKAIQTAEKEELNLNPDPVFFMSFVGVDSKGFVKEHEHIFDIYTKLYDFVGCDVKVISAQDLWDFYESKHPGADKKKTDVYTMAEFFVDQHSNGHFIVDECPFKRGEAYDESSVNQLKEFVQKCRRKLQGDSNLFWVAMQSNQLADTVYDVEDDFNEALHAMKEELTKDEWILPQLESNMRNQINISNINVERSDVDDVSYQMQSSIPKLKSGTNIVGELPIYFKVRSDSEWYKKEDNILTHCVQEMNKKDNKNVVILHDDGYIFKDVGKDLKILLKDKTVIEYPSNEGKKKDIQNIKDFIEKDDHILFTRNDYFNGCEASNIIYLNSSFSGIRNSLMRGVKNLILVEVDVISKISGMKEDNRFY